MRIIAGQLRGRALGPAAAGVRPTSDRVRESLFGWLGEIGGRRVLDLFAGTGALGLEAFSRGAERVVFVERSRAVARALNRRLERLELAGREQLEVLPLPAARALSRLAERSDPTRFDLVFVDPPYEERPGAVRHEIATALFASGLLAADAEVVVERPTRQTLGPVAGARVVREQRYGDTTLTLLERGGRARASHEEG